MWPFFFIVEIRHPSAESFENQVALLSGGENRVSRFIIWKLILNLKLKHDKAPTNRLQNELRNLIRLQYFSTLKEEHLFEVETSEYSIWHTEYTSNYTSTKGLLILCHQMAGFLAINRFSTATLFPQQACHNCCLSINCFFIILWKQLLVYSPLCCVSV